MNCYKCGKPSKYVFERDDSRAYLCGTHARRYRLDKHLRPLDGYENWKSQNMPALLNAVAWAESKTK